MPGETAAEMRMFEDVQLLLILFVNVPQRKKDIHPVLDMDEIATKAKIVTDTTSVIFVLFRTTSYRGWLALRYKFG